MAQQQIGFFGKFKPTGVDTSGADKLRMLAGLSDQVGEIAFQKGAKIRQKQGALEGAQSVKRNEEGRVIAPEINDDDTIFGRAFSESAILAHKAQVSMDARQDLDRIQEKFKFDPQGFKNATSGVKSGILKGMPEELAVIISSDLDNSISNRHAKIMNDSFKRESAKQRSVALASIETIQDDLSNDARNGIDTTQGLINANIELDAWVEAGKISFDEARVVKENTSERLQEQNVLHDIDKIVFNEDFSLEEQFLKGTDFVKSLRGQKEIKDLSAEQKDSLTRVVESKVSDIGRRIAQRKKERDITKEKIISDLKIETNLVLDKAKEGDSVDFSSLVERTEILHNKGDISGNERTSIGTHIAKAIDEFDRISLADKRIIAKMQGDDSIVIPGKDSDFFYKRKVKDDIDSLPVELQGVAKSNYILKTRTIPKQIKSEIINNILSGNSDLIKQSSELIDRIDDIPGMANMAITANQRAFMENVLMLSENLVPEQAIKEARRLTDPSNKARVEAREVEIREEDLKDDYEGIVESRFSSFFGFDNLTSGLNKEKMTAEYGELFETFFKNGMEEDSARSKALEMISNNWKESEFGIMKHKPEDFYHVNGQTDYIKKDLITSIRSSGIGVDFDNENVFLFSDDETSMKARTGQPDYKVVVIDSNGQMQKLAGRWFPDRKAEVDRQSKKIKDSAEEKRRLSGMSKENKVKQTIDAIRGIF